MARYLLLWEADESKIPLDPEERKMGWLGAIEMEWQNICNYFPIYCLPHR